MKFEEIKKEKKHLFIEQDGEEFLWWWGEKRSEHFTSYFCTDKSGHGIFHVDLEHNAREQIVGTCDFSLRGLKDPKRAIRRWYERSEED